MDLPREAPRLPEHLLANSRVIPDRYALLPMLPKGRVIAEVGVAVGNFSADIIRLCEPSRFIAIDLFDLHTKPELWGKPTAEWFEGKTHLNYYRDRFADLVASDRMLILQENSANALEQLDDRSVDIFYVDADHAYEAVRGELAVIKRKVREDGLIIVNDYVLTEAPFGLTPYGVIQATNEFMIEEGWEMLYFALQPYMFCDVVLRKYRE